MEILHFKHLGDTASVGECHILIPTTSGGWIYTPYTVVLQCIGN